MCMQHDNSNNKIKNYQIAIYLSSFSVNTYFEVSSFRIFGQKYDALCTTKQQLFHYAYG